MLYVKEGRRYSQATDSAILLAAAEVLFVHKVDSTASIMSGMAIMLESHEKSFASRQAKRIDNQKKEDAALVRLGKESSDG